MNAESTLPSPARAEHLPRRWLRWAGRLILGAWAAFWIWFHVASLVGEAADPGLGAWLNHGLLAVVILAVTLLAYATPRLGALALLLLAAGLGTFFHGAKPVVQLFFVAPPAVAGLLLGLTARSDPR